MGHEIVYCSRCQSRLKGADFDAGTAVRISNYIYCAGCLTPEERQLAAKLSKPPETPPSTRRSASIKAVSASSGAIAAAPRKSPEPGPAGRKPLIFAGAGAGVLVVIALIVVLTRGGEKKAPAEAPPPPSPERTIHLPNYADEFDEVQRGYEKLAKKTEYRAAHELLGEALARHGDASWKGMVAQLQDKLARATQAHYDGLKRDCDKALERKLPTVLFNARDELARWGPPFQPFLRQFEEAYGAALAAPPEPPEPPPVKPEEPPPPPAKPTPDSGPVLVADPERTNAGKKYLAPWQKAMGFASRSDYDAAAVELKSAGREFQEPEVQKELAADLQDLARLPALRAELLKAMAALPSWTTLTLEVTQEDGARGTVKGQLLQAGPRRLELRGEPRYVELEDVAPGSLVRVYLQKKKDASADERRLLALLCALDGNEAAMTAVGVASPPKVRNYCTSLKGKPPSGDAAARQGEWAARRLYYQAEAEFRSLETRAAALEKFDTLLGAHSGTVFVKANRPDIAARKDELRDYAFTALRMKGKSVFSVQKVQVTSGKEKDKFEMTAWKAMQEPAADDPNAYVEVNFFALPETEYKSWALIGGCCTTTFTWFLQATDLTYVDKKTRKTLHCDPGSNFAAPWDLKIKNLSVLHGGKGHTKAEKDPLQWEWVEVPMPRYAAGGVKSIRFMAASKGMSLAAVLVTSTRDKRPALEDAKKLADAAIEEGVPTSSLKAGKGEPDLLVQIPEARPYVLVHDLDLARLSKPVKYDADHRAEVKGPFDRIAYLLELQKGTAPGQYVFVSMDAFTDDINKVGIPDTGSFQQKVTSMNVHTNVESLAAGIGLDGGNIEFWTNNYGPANAANVPGASGSAFDFGDQIGQPVDGYGSMQVHNFKAGQTIFGLNHWRNGGGADLGIGNGTGQNPDYTFNANAGSYSYKRLRVLVRPR